MPKAIDVVSKKVVKVKKDTRIKAICKLLIQNKISGVSIVDDKGRLIGYVSERDVINGFQKDVDFLKQKAGDIMTKKVVSVTPDISLYDVAKIFTNKPFRNIPVVDKDKKVIGVIARKDVTDKLLRQYY